MKINIRNDRGRIIASIEVKSDSIVEETLSGCCLSDVDINDDGEGIYRLDIVTPENLVEELSNEALLREIRNRMSE